MMPLITASLSLSLPLSPSLFCGIVCPSPQSVGGMLLQQSLDEIFSLQGEVGVESDLMVEDTVDGLLAILSTKWRLKEHHKHPTHTHSLHTYIYTYIHTYIHTYIYTYIHTCMHTYIHTYIHCTYIYTYIHTYIHTYSAGHS